MTSQSSYVASSGNPLYSHACMTSTMKAYWDKATGFTCEISMSMSGEYEGETVEVSISYKITETNMWEAEAAPLWMEWWLWIVVVMVIVALAGAVYFSKKRKPPTPTASTPPAEGTQQDIQRRLLKTPTH